MLPGEGAQLLDHLFSRQRLALRLELGVQLAHTAGGWRTRLRVDGRRGRHSQPSGRNLVEKELHHGPKLVIDCRKKGDSAGTEENYLAVLHIDPNHMDGNHNYGLLLGSLGKINVALKRFK